MPANLRGKEGNKKPENYIQDQVFNLVTLSEPQKLRVSDGKRAREGQNHPH